MKGLERAPKGRKKTWQRPTEKKPGSDLLSRKTAVPSARGCFTSVFGMGTGVSALLWPPGGHPEAYRYASDDPFGIGTIIWPSLSDH